MDKPPTTAPDDLHLRYVACRIRRTVSLLLLCASLPSMAPGYETGHPITGEAKAAFLQTWGEPLQTMRSLHMTVMQEKHLRLLRRLEKNGSRSIMKIATFTLNPKISEAQLDIHIPPGTRVVYPLK